MSSGHYIALHFSVPNVDDVTIKVTLNRETTLDSDGLVVGYVSDKNSQTITVVASKDGYKPVMKVYFLSGLMCEEEPEPDPI